MKNLLIIALLFITSVLTAQVDTSYHIDMSKNVSRSAPEKGGNFQRKLIQFREESTISYITLIVLYSNGYRIEYTLDEVIRMEEGKFFPFRSVQNDIIKMIDSYYP